MSYKPIAPAPATPGAASASPAPPGPAPPATSVPSPSGSVPGAAAPFRPLFNDFGPPSMGYVQASSTPGRWSGSAWQRQSATPARNGSCQPGPPPPNTLLRDPPVSAGGGGGGGRRAAPAPPSPLRALCSLYKCVFL
ncbi:cyclin-dependent kinase 2-associated protein 2 isoform X1 [Rissa tridactyla]|uniref:cyclin-dependent kinase 2-associated protein 2 isoform X1 n=1 Tax=Rissa tridactyla TaxID=75485 RepID=UPI0023BA96AE|nr:cyclin-dependent kinase 2-associated protein 2 isoform X1 [Rissa tridactyla]